MSSRIVIPTHFKLRLRGQATYCFPKLLPLPRPTPARTADIGVSPTTAAATGTVRSARAPPRAPGLPSVRPTCCRSATSMSCSRCRPRSPTLRSRTRRWSTICCSSGVGDDADHRCGSQAPRRTHRHHRRAPHLGIGDDASSACPHDRAGRRHRAGRKSLGLVATGLPFRCACLGRCSAGSSSPG